MVGFVDVERVILDLVAGYRIVVEQIPEVALLHSHMVVESAVHRRLAEVEPWTVPKAPRSPCVLL